MRKSVEAKLQADKDIREELKREGKSFICISVRQWNEYCAYV